MLSLAAGAGILVAVFAGAPIAARILGHGPNDPFPFAVDASTKPVGPLTRVPAVHSYPGEALPRAHATTLLLFGADGPLGRDEFLRVLYGGQVSLEVALGATALAAILGAFVGALAGLVGGALDTSVSRLTELVMAFPLLLFLILAARLFSEPLSRVTLHGLVPSGVVSTVVLIAMFTWFYPARLVRAQVRVLRGQEFVVAAEMVGASRLAIVRRHLIPHLLPTLAAYASVAIATNIILDASLTFLGVGIQLPTSSWGSLLSATWGSVSNPGSWDASRNTIWQTLFPTGAITLSVLAFTALAEAVRRASDLEATFVP